MNRLIFGLIIVFWLTMMGLLFQKELLPDLVMGPPPTYRRLLAHKSSGERMRMVIYCFDQRVGASDGVTTVREDGSYLLRNIIRIDVSHLSETLRESWRYRLQVSASTEIEVSAQGKLHRFRMEINSPIVQAVLSGIVEGQELAFTVSTAGQRIEHRIPYDPELILATSLNPFAELTGLEVGKKWQTAVLSPRTLEMTFATIEVIGEGKTYLGGREVEFYNLRTELDGFPVSGWVGKDGKLLKVMFPPLEFIREPDGRDRTGEGNQTVRQ